VVCVLVLIFRSEDLGAIVRSLVRAVAVCF